MAWHEKADAGYPWSVTSEGAIFRPLCGPSLSAPLATPPNHVSFGRALEGCWRRPRRHDSTRCDWLLGGATCRADRSSLRNDTDPRVVVSSSLLRPPPSSGHCRTSPIAITQHVAYLLCATTLGLPSDLRPELGSCLCLSAHVCCCRERSRESQRVCYDQLLRGPSVSQHKTPRRLCSELVTWPTIVCVWN